MDQGPLSTAQAADKLDSWAAQLSETAQTLRSSPGRAGLSLEHRSSLLKTGHDITQFSRRTEEYVLDTMASTVELVALRLLINWKALEMIPAQGSITYQELAEKVGAEVSLISESRDLPCGITVNTNAGYQPVLRGP